MGHLFCFDAASGEVRWRKDLGSEYKIDMPIWGISAAPVIEGEHLIVPVSGKDAYLVAFDRKTGEEQWRAFSDRGNYSAPIVINHAGERVLVCWSGDRVLGVAPTTGELHWQYPLKAKNMPLACAAPVLHQDKLFLTAFYDGCALLELDPQKLSVRELWRRRGRNEWGEWGRGRRRRVGRRAVRQRRLNERGDHRRCRRGCLFGFDRWRSLDQ